MTWKRNDIMDSLFNRYALGLFSIALEENKVQEYKNSLKMIKSVILNDADFIHLLSSCFLTQEEKDEVIDEVFNNEDKYVLNFIKVIVKNKRVNLLRSIFDEFNEMCNDYLGIKEGIIYSTYLLELDKVEKLEKTFKKVFGVEVELTNHVDEKLIGGIKVIIEDQVFDGTIISKLNSLKQSLIGGK